MNEEEKNAAEFIKDLISWNVGVDLYPNKKECEKLETILNLIEKLQKENEELKEDRDKFKKALGKRITYCNELEKDLFENCSNYVISVQKVKDKIEKEIKYHEKNILDIENITMLKSKTAKEEAEIELNKYVIVVLKKKLQELLEEED